MLEHPTRPTDSPACRNPDATAEGRKSARSPRAERRARKKKPGWVAGVAEEGWRLSPFRLLLYAAFSVPELAGDPQQPPVRGRGRNGDGLEFRRVGRGAATEFGRRNSSRSVRTGSRPPWYRGSTPPDRGCGGFVILFVGSGTVLPADRRGPHDRLG